MDRKTRISSFGLSRFFNYFNGGYPGKPLKMGEIAVKLLSGGIDESLRAGQIPDHFFSFL